MKEEEERLLVTLVHNPTGHVHHIEDLKEIKRERRVSDHSSPASGRNGTHSSLVHLSPWEMTQSVDEEEKAAADLLSTS
jgi:hypothetical protein